MLHTSEKKTKYTEGNYFLGNEISQYGIENGRVDYGTLAATFNAVPNNSIIANTADIGYWELYSGQYWEDEDGEQYPKTIYQYFIIDGIGAEILQHWTDELVFYNDELNMFVWGVTHLGTAWEYVLTDIEIRKENES